MTSCLVPSLELAGHRPQQAGLQASGSRAQAGPSHQNSLLPRACSCYLDVTRLYLWNFPSVKLFLSVISVKSHENFSRRLLSSPPFYR